MKTAYFCIKKQRFVFCENLEDTKISELFFMGEVEDTELNFIKDCYRIATASPYSFVGVNRMVIEHIEESYPEALV